MKDANEKKEKENKKQKKDVKDTHEKNEKENKTIDYLENSISNSKPYFIHKDPKKFIRECMQSYLTEFFWSTSAEFNKDDIKKFQAITTTIDEISDELFKVENELKNYRKNQKLHTHQIM